MLDPIIVDFINSLDKRLFKLESNFETFLELKDYSKETIESLNRGLVDAREGRTIGIVDTVYDSEYDFRTSLGSVGFDGEGG